MDTAVPTAKLTPGSVALLGLPWDAMSTHMRGPAEAPSAIREALHGGSANLWSERGRDLGEHPRFVDMGDVKLPEDVAALDAISEAVQSVLSRGAKPLVLGGDHAVTLGVLRAVAQRWSPLTVLHVDAHPDLYASYEGNPFSHACPFARALEEGLVSRLVQVGIRTLNGHQREQVERFGVEVIEAHAFDPNEQLGLVGPVYVSIDLDGLDPAFAPGVSHHEPGGLSTRDVLRLLNQLPKSVVGADVVELNPRRDLHGMTAMVAAKLAKELACRLLDERDPLSSAP
ncbi:MAG: agmatinase [Myxococcales bacterium FL481]|nr:MAG: agmatinase [Myxococcales bacterium FL481]